MGTIKQKLQAAINSKNDIRTAIVNKGVTMPTTTTFANYDSVITNNLMKIPTATISITTTASYDVTNYATAQVSDVNLVASKIPEGTTILGVQGSMPFVTLYTGSSTPSSSLGVNGDVYLELPPSS